MIIDLQEISLFKPFLTSNENCLLDLDIPYTIRTNQFAADIQYITQAEKHLDPFKISRKELEELIENKKFNNEFEEKIK